MDGESAWYRARLLDVAIEKLPEYWLYGYGRANPGWGRLINGMNWTDGVNDYVVHASNYGIFGLAICVLLQITAIRRMARIVRRARDPWLVSAAWTLNATLISLMAAFWSVSLFSTMVTIYYILIALIAAVDVMSRPHMAELARPPAQRRSVRPRRVAAPVPVGSIR
jgi:O-antigen ligase